MISDEQKDQLSKLEPGDEFPDWVDMKLMAVNWAGPNGDIQEILTFSRDGSIDMTSSKGERLSLSPPENWIPITKIPAISDIPAINGILFAHLVDKFIEVSSALILIRNVAIEIEEYIAKEGEE